MNQRPLLERRSPLRINYALLILVAFFFLLPSGFRAARLSLSQKENDVKDWLPSDFPETAELEWFADHFAGESFVLATWPGCVSGDQRLKLLEQKLLHESDTFDPSADFPLELAESYRRAKQVGNELQLLLAGSDFYNWGGEEEKWLSTPDGQWYYIKPNGHLYRWDEASNGPAAIGRQIRKSLGNYKLNGTFVTGFGEPPSETQFTNPFYNNPSIICATLFHSVQTGDSILDELAREGGPLWPIDLTDQDRRSTVARRRAMERLTGTLFAPAINVDFEWTAEAFRNALPESQQEQLPEAFDDLVQFHLNEILAKDFEASLDQLKQAPLKVRTDAWYAIHDAIEVQPPPRLTCVLITLTDLAKDNLGYALGRGIMGQPRGRLLTLAAESGVQPPAPPSMAPPPFNRAPVESVDGKPPLRIGGPPVDNTAIDEEGTVTLVRLVGYSIVLGIVLSYICFGSVKITLMVFIVGGCSAMLSMAMVWWTSGKVDAILLSMPSLVYVLGISGAIHVVNYYRDEVRIRGKAGAPGRALRHALLPCTLASITTAIGLASLFTSNLAPISNFGFYSAIGVIMTLAVLFSYLPAALQVFAPKFEGSDETVSTSPPESRLSDWWAAVGRWITSHHAMVSSACLLLLAVCSLGLLNIKTSVQLLKLFDPDSRIIHDYGWLEDNFGKLVPMELIVRVPPSMQAEYSVDGTENTGNDNSKASEPSIQSLTMLERVEAISRIRTVVNRTLGEPGRGVVGQVTSANTVLPPLPAPSNSYSPIRAKFNRELLAGRQDLRDNDYLRLEKSDGPAESELWRISLRVAALSDVDYGYFISTLRESVEPVLRAYDTRDEILQRLTTDQDGEPKKLDSKSRILVVSEDRPATLLNAELIYPDGQINRKATYNATLAELLNGERLEAPSWLNVSAEKAEALTSNPKWSDSLKKFDAIVWLGSDVFKKEDFEASGNFIDATSIRDKVITPKLTSERIPDVIGSGPIQVIYTGVVPVVYKAQRTLLTSLTHSIAMAFVLIALVMIWLLNPGRLPVGWMKPSNLGNGLAAGLISMIPNVFPVLIVFGVMCHLNIEIDIGTMMTASVAMGVAVDDTIHFLSWFRAHLDEGMSRVEAVIQSYRRVGPAMTQTTIVGGLGLFVFALSTFTPTQRFGTLMLVMLLAALVGDLILLPALLAGPAGRFFKPRDQRRAKPTDSVKTTATQQHDSVEMEVVTPNTAKTPSNAPAAAEEDDAVPHLRLHFPRKDPAHRIKRRQ
ncbi:MAG: MMPL family transporter [Rubripirellula sp.]|nr:MMPL family transporter [Rubripirellula sp.]